MKNKAPLFSWILLVATTAIFVFIRLRLLNLPLERDEGEYAYAGQQLLHGGLPYRDIYNMKFPGVYYCYSLFLMLFGNTISAIRIGALLVNLLTAFFILKTGEKINSTTMGIFAASAFLALSIAPHFQGIMANAEHFVNLFVAIGAFLLFSWINSENKIFLFFTGIMAGIACLMKQHGIYFSGVAFAAIFIYSPLQKGNLLKTNKNILTLLVGCCIPILSLIGYVAATNNFNKFVFLTMKYGRSYISGYTFSYGFFRFFFSFANSIVNNHLIWIVVMAGLILSYKLLSKKLFLIMLTWFILSIVAVFPGYYFRDHYFLYMVLPSAIYFGLFFNYLTSLRTGSNKFMPHLLSIALFTGALLYILIGERRIFFTDTPQMAVANIYHDQQFNEAVTVADSVKKYLLPNQHMLVVGSEPEIYFYTNSTSASSYVYMYPMMENQPWRDSMTNEFIHQAIYNKPAVVILSRRTSADYQLEDRVLNKVIAADTNLRLKGICYQVDTKDDAFIWNKEDENKSTILWKIYVRMK